MYKDKIIISIIFASTCFISLFIFHKLLHLDLILLQFSLTFFIRFIYLIFLKEGTNSILFIFSEPFYLQLTFFSSIHLLMLSLPIFFHCFADYFMATPLELDY